MKKLTVSLTGGLGNQLFQYAAGIYFSVNAKLALSQDLGKPRQNESGQAEILNFGNLPHLENLKSDWLSQKFAGYLLRMGVYRKSWEFLPIIRPLITSISSLYLSLVNRRVIHIEGYPALGLRRDFSLHVSTNLLVGYFQNSKYASEPRVKEKLSSLYIENPSKAYKEIAEAGKEKRPLVVHLRLGDYRNEESFGILPINYYESAIRALWETQKFDQIWLFSDEIESASRKLSKYSEYIREIPASLSPAESLDLMRFGYGYVIANSTFSWWGAFLTRNVDAPVIAPEKWFKGLNDPEDLIPDEWIRVKTW